MSLKKEWFFYVKNVLEESEDNIVAKGHFYCGATAVIAILKESKNPFIDLLNIENDIREHMREIEDFVGDLKEEENDRI